MALRHELHNITKSYHKWLKKKFRSRTHAPCRMAMTVAAKAKSLKMSIPTPSLSIPKASLSSLKEQTAITAPSKEQTAPEKTIESSFQDKFKTLRDEYTKMHPHISFSSKPLDDQFAHQIINTISKTPSVSFYFFIPKPLLQDPFYTSVLKALKIHGLPSEIYDADNFNELAFAKIPSSLRAIFLPSSFFSHDELNQEEKLTQNTIKKQYGVPTYALYPPEHYTGFSKNKVKLWNALKSLSPK